LADPPRHDPTDESDSMSYATPRWAKVFGITMAVVILLFVVLRFTVFAGD